MYLLDKNIFVFMVPQAVMLENIEEEQKQLISMIQQHSIRVVIFDFSRVQVITTDGMSALIKVLYQLHLLGLDCHVMAILGHLALPMVDFFSELPFLKFHRSIWDVPYHEPKRSLMEFLNFDETKEMTKSKLDFANAFLPHPDAEISNSENRSPENDVSSWNDPSMQVFSQKMLPGNDFGGDDQP